MKIRMAAYPLLAVGLFMGLAQLVYAQELKQNKSFNQLAQEAGIQKSEDLPKPPNVPTPTRYLTIEKVQGAKIVVHAILENKKYRQYYYFIPGGSLGYDASQVYTKTDIALKTLKDRFGENDTAYQNLLSMKSGWPTETRCHYVLDEDGNKRAECVDVIKKKYVESTVKEIEKLLDLKTL